MSFYAGIPGGGGRPLPPESHDIVLAGDFLGNLACAVDDVELAGLGSENADALEVEVLGGSLGGNGLNSFDGGGAGDGEGGSHRCLVALDKGDGGVGEGLGDEEVVERADPGVHGGVEGYCHCGSGLVTFGAFSSPAGDPVVFGGLHLELGAGLDGGDGDGVGVAILGHLVCGIVHCPLVEGAGEYEVFHNNDFTCFLQLEGVAVSGESEGHVVLAGEGLDGVGAGDDCHHCHIAVESHILVVNEAAVAGLVPRLSGEEVEVCLPYKLYVSGGENIAVLVHEDCGGGFPHAGCERTYHIELGGGVDGGVAAAAIAADEEG